LYLSTSSDLTFGSFDNNLTKTGFDLLVLQTAPFRVGIPVPLFFSNILALGGLILNRSSSSLANLFKFLSIIPTIWLNSSLYI